MIHALAAMVVFVCTEFVFSALFFWPRNTIMFVDPVGTHSADHLRTVAAEFEAGHWVRVVGGVVTSALAFTGLLRLYRGRVFSVPHATRPDATATPS
ncbi:hypothetical protein [Streptosporangium sp. NPDC023615]|uniref:hypothetical protein n=1 Tax=Streptosporangium sp. NPDC023615 TaxID=3154794 RepID=UPI003412B95E